MYISQEQNRDFQLNMKQNNTVEFLSSNQVMESLDENSNLNPISIIDDQLNSSKINQPYHKNNLRIIRQLEHKLNKQKEVNRDLRVEKDMFTLKLEETEKRISEMSMT